MKLYIILVSDYTCLITRLYMDWVGLRYHHTSLFFTSISTNNRRCFLFKIQVRCKECNVTWKFTSCYMKFVYLLCFLSIHLKGLPRKESYSGNSSCSCPGMKRLGCMDYGYKIMGTGKNTQFSYAYMYVKYKMYTLG